MDSCSKLSKLALTLLKSNFVSTAVLAVFGAVKCDHHLIVFNDGFNSSDDSMQYSVIGSFTMGVTQHRVTFLVVSAWCVSVLYESEIEN
jgi:hypothetical protein